jgi:hypothetical protein
LETSSGAEFLAEYVLVLAPMGRDALLCSNVLAQAGVETRTCADVGALCEALAEIPGAVVVVEECLTPLAVERLRVVLERQESWSDLPILILSAQAVTRRRPLEAFSPLGNVSLLDRPTDPKILISSCSRPCARGAANMRPSSPIAGRKPSCAWRTRFNGSSSELPVTICVIR